MWTIFIAIGFFLQISNIHAQANVCTAAAVAACNPYPCVQTDTQYSCLCPNMQLAQSAAACGTLVPTVPTPGIPNICGNAICPAGATCVPTNQNPARYVCICPNNIIANPSCPTTPLPNNPCLQYNPCLNGGTCVVDQLTLQAICVCPPTTYGSNCAAACSINCNNWCYNGGQCINTLGQAYCACPYNYRGRRCELRYNQYNYLYLSQNPYYYYYGKK